MSVTDGLLQIVERNRRGERAGIYSICSADRFVLQAGMAQAARDGSIVTIESTCNQVNQFGGYTGMAPADFRRFVGTVAAEMGLPATSVVLGGDHLGPFVWRAEPATSAMEKARELVRGCVLAGYTKLHLDTSMRCADDPDGPLDEHHVTERAVELCRVAEDAHAELPAGAAAPVYVIGTEVPIPGGELADTAGPTVTRVEDVERTLTLTREAFERRGMGDAWERVLGLVVQPGVEFGDAVVFDYDPEGARDLASCVERYPHLVYEAHSTDHQTAGALGRLVQDHFAILKVGPWLTFAMREALFALELIERELLAGDDRAETSRLREVLEATMLAHPVHWEPYQHGGARELRLARLFGYSDRARYYWPRSELREAVGRLLANLSAREIPATLLSQYLPAQYEAVRVGELDARPVDLVRHKVLEVADLYASACGMR